MSAVSTRAALLGLVSLFLLPLVIAWLMYVGVIEWRPEGTRNRGELVQPPVPASLPDEFDQRHIRGHWTLVYPLSLASSESSREELIGLRQVLRALGRDAERVRIVVLASEKATSEIVQTISQIEPEFAVFTAGSEALRAQLKEIGDGRGTYVVDPLGNIMMHYPRGSDPNDIRKDLEQLLRYGKTDPQQ